MAHFSLPTATRYYHDYWRLMVILQTTDVTIFRELNNDEFVHFIFAKQRFRHQPRKNVIAQLKPRVLSRSCSLVAHTTTLWIYFLNHSRTKRFFPSSHRPLIIARWKLMCERSLVKLAICTNFTGGPRIYVFCLT